MEQRARRELPHWSEVSELRARVRAAPGLAVALDVDGTLAPVRSNPADVRVPAGTRDLLAALARRPDVRVAAVSGRRWSDLRALVDVPGVRLYAEYGARVDDGAGPRDDPRAAAWRAATDEARRRLDPIAREVPGAWVERKDVNVVLHVRDADPAEGARALERARTALADLLAPRGPLACQPGRKSLEVRPADAPTKGDALRRLHAEMPGALPIFVGDDVGDEPGFEAAAELGGFGIWVASDEVPPGPTCARCRLDGPDDVRAWLAELVALRAGAAAAG